MCLMRIRHLYMLGGLIFASTAMDAQEDLLSKLEKEQPIPSYDVLGTFKGNYLSIGHSVETRKKGVLEISSMNRFWNVPEPTSQSFVADRWNARVGASYAVNDRFTVGVGYGTGYNSTDVFLKYRLVHQQGSKLGSPLSVTFIQGGVYRGKTKLPRNIDLGFDDRIAFTSQLLIARKITPNFSLQIAPTYIYRGEENVISSEGSNRFAFGFGGRYRLGGHVSLVSEYYYLVNPVTFVDTYGPFTLGVNWEVADLLLQFKLTNARNFVEDKFIVKTTNNFNTRDGNFHFGFHATYTLHFNKR